jgi:hypothetical protein
LILVFVVPVESTTLNSISAVSTGLGFCPPVGVITSPFVPTCDDL